MNCPMLLTPEIFQRARDAMARRVGRTGGVDHARLAQRAGNQRLVPDGTKSQYAVNPS
jgi:hypothetical protein